MSCAPALGRPQRGALPQKTYAIVEPDGSNCLKGLPILRNGCLVNAMPSTTASW